MVKQKLIKLHDLVNRLNNEEIIDHQYKLKPYPSFEDYFDKNKDFLKLKYEEFKQ